MSSFNSGCINRNFDIFQSAADHFHRSGKGDAFIAVFDNGIAVAFAVEFDIIKDDLRRGGIGNHQCANTSGSRCVFTVTGFNSGTGDRQFDIGVPVFNSGAVPAHAAVATGNGGTGNGDFLAAGTHIGVNSHAADTAGAA